uniref:Thioredoxin domain-containing protein n=1 Tax=Mantoniella antarctica TaxID=81844 RepID=A0A7S0SY16_9CHLO|mmetsp:Transcript_13759/g.22515  ORF Transcript_13759/g.22515 Transcript_13759/m.22515 type:complete len:231 (-) Transcript_13759:131-823(-)|eukprot:CAMPEP_0181369928 /NCGR_PEP_ID=MMETSP1106-20121128/13090_1 /TAXON_ID=81844 /ORGANISM="Mantoniella antarctica, Strain SL-175" /LENGTH=230 /DNA_ID=CAMNT_0023486559 /DNA_START=69 /DNA_END=761 /DNA_ORIENTATION=-
MAQDAQQQMMEKKLYEMAKSMEDALDDELHKMNNMDTDDLENIRRKRMEAMKGDQDKRKKWLAAGHGELRDLADEKEFFSQMKGEKMMVCHFYRNNWPCKVMDMHLTMLSKKHLETKFCKIDAEKSPFLTERLKIWMLPTLALVSNSKVVDYVVGFDDLGGSDDFPTEHLRCLLANKSMLTYEGGDNEDARATMAKKNTSEEEVVKRNLRKGGVAADMVLGSDDEDSDFE